MQAFQAPGARRSSDPSGKLGAQLSLLVVRSLETLGKCRILSSGPRPALDTAVRLEPGNRSDQVRAGEVVRGRERGAGHIAWPLLSDGRAAVGTADDYAPKGAGRTTELSRNDGLILHLA
jgi:hypothetical protein